MPDPQSQGPERPVIHGAGPLAAALSRDLAAVQPQGELMVWVAPEARHETPEAALQHLYLTPLRLVEAWAKAAPPPLRDLTGEPAATRQALLVVERRLLVGGSGHPAHHAAVVALLAWAGEAALSLAPALRLNVLAVPLEDPPDLRPCLGWLTGRAVVTGQVVKLGPAPPSSAPFRGGKPEKAG